MTSVAIIVLSGSSATKMRPKVTATTARSMSRLRDGGQWEARRADAGRERLAPRRRA